MPIDEPESDEPAVTRRPLRRATLILLAAALTMMLAVALARLINRQAGGGDMTARGREAVDLNTADEAALTLLPGIGPTNARAIVQYRQEHGPFASLEELRHVRNIGATTLRKIEPYVSCGNNDVGSDP